MLPPSARLLAAALLLALCAACGALPPVHAYDGPARAPSELARVTALSRHDGDGIEWTDARLFIAAVGDRSTHDPFAVTTATDPETVYVLPGEHTFTLHHVSTRGVLVAQLRFGTEAGHSYLILQDMQDDTLRLEVQDVTDRQRTATGEGSDAPGPRTIAALPPR